MAHAGHGNYPQEGEFPLTKRISTQTALSKFSDQRVKGIISVYYHADV